MRLGVLYSGGKDSHVALNVYFQDVVGLITIKPSEEHPYLYHGINLDMVKLHSQLMNLPLIYWRQEKDELDALYQALERAIRIWDIDGIVSGGIRSNYQYSRIKKACNDLELKLYTPLWNINIDDYFNLYEKYTIKSILVGVYAYPLDEHYVFRDYNKELAIYLKSLNIDPFGEGGEFESFVYSSRILPQIKYSMGGVKGKHNSWTGYIKI